LVTFNREIYLQSLLKTDLKSGGYFNVRSETPIPLGHDYCNTPCEDLEESSDPLSPFAVASSLRFSTVSDHPEGSLIFHDSSLPLAPLEELKEGDDLEADASLDDQRGTIVKPKDTFSGEHSLYKPYVVEFSEVTPHIKLINPLSDESSLDLGPAPLILSLSSALPPFLPSLDLPGSTFVESETSMLGNPC